MRSYEVCNYVFKEASKQPPRMHCDGTQVEANVSNLFDDFAAACNKRVDFMHALATDHDRVFHNLYMLLRRVKTICPDSFVALALTTLPSIATCYKDGPIEFMAGVTLEPIHKVTGEMMDCLFYKVDSDEAQRLYRKFPDASWHMQATVRKAQQARSVAKAKGRPKAAQKALPEVEAVGDVGMQVSVPSSGTRQHRPLEQHGCPSA